MVIKKEKSPLLPLRDIVVYPKMIVPLFVGRPKSINALQKAVDNDQNIVLATQKDPTIEDPSTEDIFHVGTLGTVLQLLKLPDGTVKALIEGLERVSLEKINLMPIEQARTELMKIKGVGPKVAECTLLYGFGRLEAFPVDVWVKRIMAEMYADGLPECTKNYEGIAQQYLFHWRRNSKEFKGD